MNGFARTDLASEAFRQRFSDEVTTISGISTGRDTVHGFPVSHVSVESDEASEAIGKPKGRYLTLELDKYVNRREGTFSDASTCLSELLRSFPDIKNADSYLIACLGNKAITPDSLGPDAADSIIVTRHLKSGMPEAFAAFSSVSVLRTGVLGTTGMETASTLQAVCGSVKPDCVIAIDALASGELDRLCRNIQICDSGISPGSGVGNDRSALNSGLLGVPVIAVGVPTVIDASVFTEDESAKGLFVTPRNIDELIRSTAKLIAYGINLAVHDGLGIEDIEMLIE